MEEKKHIDRLYQEKFKDFEATPHEAVWKGISSRLKEKDRKKRILPIWYRIAGVAALLALIFNVANNFFLTSTKSNTQTTTAQQGDTFGVFDLASTSFKQNMFRSSLILQGLMQATSKEEIQKQLVLAEKLERSPEAPVAVTPFIVTKRNSLTPNILLSGPGFSNYSSTAYEELEVPNQSPETLSEVDAFSLLIKEDSDSNKTVETQSRRLSITTTAAPIYFNNISNGSAIDEQFANNESGSAISMAYGLNFAYQISKKIKIRSGVSKVDLSYNTRDIAFTAAVNPAALSGVKYEGDIPKYRIENSSPRLFNNISASAEFSRSSFASPTSGYLNQRVGFVEVPLEIEYVLIDKKIGLNLIGGGSTLFLNDNVISLNSSNFSTDLGEANNLNSVSFSTNIGVGVDYNLSPQFQLNVEPIFKYQINTFTTSTNVNPYYFGVYSGFTFKF